MATVQNTITLVPSSYDSDHAYYSASNINRGYTDADSTTYAQVNLTRGAGAITYFYYKFDTSAIPAGATIDSVSCSAKLRIGTANSKYVTTRQIQMFSGTTAMGSPTTVPNSNTVLTLTPGTWDLQDIQDTRIRLYAVRGNSNVDTSYGFVFYGATLTITYSYDVAELPFRVKQNGAWVEANKVFVKASGIWNEATKVLTKSGGTWT